jgi:hypothetical protein
VNVTRDDAGLSVQASSYRLSFPSGRPFAFLQGRDGTRWATLFLGASLHTRTALDETAALVPPEVAESASAVGAADSVTVTVDATSTAWRRRRLVFTCFEERVEAHVEVEGEGDLTDVHLFGGYYSGHLRWGSGFFGSGALFKSVFNPEPWSSERRALPATESTVIDVMGTSLPGKGHWFFTPAPFCYGFSARRPAARGGLPKGPWLMAGLGASLQEHTFTGFHYEATEGAFSFHLAYEGQTHVAGRFRSPTVLLLPDAADPYEGLARYTRVLHERGWVHAPEIGVRPEWWQEPIFCGWGAQCHLANVSAKEGEQIGGAPAYARQANYDRFLETLSQVGVAPGTVVLDDKWQKDYGTNTVDEEKWPDLPGWIATRHAQGQRVLLWWKAWDPEGLPPEQCVTNAAGLPVAADPSNPAYEETLRQSVRRMLGPRASGGYDADGFKVDFSARTPSGPGLRRHGQEWGVSLLHRLLWILRDEAKRVKPDALVMTHTPNAHFQDVADMIRLNDVNTRSDVLAQMRHRAAVTRAAVPSLLVDTDNWPMPDKKTWREYVALQPELGIPSLYFATHVDSGEALEEDDYAAIRQAWAEWRRVRNAQGGAS